MSNPTILGASGLPLASSNTEKVEENAFKVVPDFNLSTGRGKVRLTMPDGKNFVLMPSEAGSLGLRLLAVSEECIGNAITLRILLEMASMSIAEAVTVLQNVSAGTRADHNAEFAAYLKEKLRSQRDEAAMGQTTGGEQ